MVIGIFMQTRLKGLEVGPIFTTEAIAQFNVFLRKTRISSFGSQIPMVPSLLNPFVICLYDVSFPHRSSLARARPFKGGNFCVDCTSKCHSHTPCSL